MFPHNPQQHIAQYLVTTPHMEPQEPQEPQQGYALEVRETVSWGETSGAGYT